MTKTVMAEFDGGGSYWDGLFAVHIDAAGFGFGGRGHDVLVTPPEHIQL